MCYLVDFYQQMNRKLFVCVHLQRCNETNLVEKCLNNLSLQHDPHHSDSAASLLSNIYLSSCDWLIDLASKTGKASGLDTPPSISKTNHSGHFPRTMQPPEAFNLVNMFFLPSRQPLVPSHSACHLIQFAAVGKPSQRTACLWF